MACDQQSFTNVTSDAWACIVQAIKDKSGIVITQPSGSMSQSGFSVTWNWIAANDSLTVQCTDKPVIVPCSLVESTIKGIVTGCGGQPS